MATTTSLSRYTCLCIILSMVAFISVSEAATRAPTPAPSPSPLPQAGHGAPPPSAATEFSQSLFVSILIAAFVSCCLSLSY